MSELYEKLEDLRVKKRIIFDKYTKITISDWEEKATNGCFSHQEKALEYLLELEEKDIDNEINIVLEQIKRARG